MSWSCQFQNPVPKAEADAAIDALTLPETTSPEIDAVHNDQLRTAKVSARMLLSTIPGPMVRVSLSGHGNGIGWQGKAGYATDFINVSVVQVADPPKTQELKA